MISIIVPVYNAEKYLDQCIQSVLSQTYPDFELILVDDGSMDKSPGIMEKWAGQDDRVHIFMEPHGGQNSARRAGFLHSEGEYIFFLDADDYIDKNMLRCQIGKIRKHGADIAVCGETKVWENRLEPMPLYDEGIYNGRELAEGLFDVNHFWEYLIVTSFHGYLFSRKVIEPFITSIDLRIQFTEDTAITMLAFLTADKVVIYSGYLYFYRVHDASISHAKKIAGYDSERHLYRFMQASLSALHAPKILFRELEQLVLRELMIHSYRDAFGYYEGVYPFSGVPRDSKVVVYGAGLFGQELVRDILSKGYCQISAWVDRRYDSLSFSYFNVENPDAILDMEYDCILVAQVIYHVAQDVHDELLLKGIPDEKIRRIDPGLISYEYINSDFFKED